jgi:hypothetical protein
MALASSCVSTTLTRLKLFFSELNRIEMVLPSRFIRLGPAACLPRQVVGPIFEHLPRSRLKHKMARYREK